MKREIKQLLDSPKLCAFDFPVYYRNRGRFITQKSNNIPPLFPEDILEYRYASTINGTDVRDLLFDPNGHSALWILNASLKDDRSVLDSVSRLFEESNRVVRGGINVYKQNGWMTHVLYVYQLISYNFAQNIIPTSFMDKSDELKNCFHKLSEIYNAFSMKSKFVIKTLALIHDIGVVDGVQHHDKDGGKYVVEILESLDINSAFINQLDFDLDYDSLAKMLEVLIENHALINKVSSEDGDECIKEKVDSIKSQTILGVDRKIDFTDFANIYLLIGMADLIAVDDSLFTVKKFELAYSSFKFLDALFNNHELNRPINTIALHRLSEMISETVYNDLEHETEAVIKKSINTDVNSFWANLYNVYKFEYSTAYFKPLKSLPGVVNSLLDLFATAAERNDSLEQCIIRFSSRMNSELFKKAVFEGDYRNCIANLKNSDQVYGKYLAMSITRENGKVLYLIDQNS